MLPITRVTLYTSGVGYFERGGEIEGDARLTLYFPVGSVNDVLKSLVLLDGGGGGIAPVTYAAQDPVHKALAAFSLDVGDNPDRATLLGRMRGVAVTLTTDDRAPLTGIISGVETQTVFLPEGQGTTERPLLTVLAGDALHTVPLDSVRSLQINDAALADELRQALAAVAQGRDAGKRPVTLTFSGEGRRAVQIGYLLEAPAWQTSYRLVLGDTPRLQGWALVQNTGQDDWSDAHLSLVSGRPISFIQDLYTPLYVHRPTVQPRIPASPTPQTYASDMMAQGIALEEPVMVGAVMAAAPAPAGPRVSRACKATDMAELGGSGMNPAQAALGSVAATGASLGAALFAYHIDVPVSVPRQQSAMIPFVAAPVEAERVSVYNSRVQADHPLSGVRLKNTTDLHLMGGPLTVFDTQDEGAAGYVGDALMDDTEAGQTRLLTYALDLAVDADAQRDSQSGIATEIRISQGTLLVRQTYQQVAVYTFKNNGAQARAIVVEYPVHPQWQLLEPSAPSERTATHYRFDLAAPGKATVALTVRTERQAWESFSLLDAANDLFLFHGRSGVASEPVRAALEEVAARRQRLADLEVRVADLDAQVQAISKGQERIRKNMEALDHKSDLYRRYVGELDKQETQIGALAAERDARQAEMTSARADLSSYVAGLSL
jgi:hypothetical protein